MNVKHNGFSAVILSAGFSSRMKMPKAKLSYDGNISFIEKIIKVFRDFTCDEIVVVLNNSLAEELKLDNDIKVVVNDYPERGRFGSIKLGLSSLTNKNKCFIQNIDNPFVQRVTLEKLATELKEFDYAFPQYNGKGGHPVLLSGKVIAEIEHINDLDLNFKNFLLNFNGISVDSDWSVAANINTPEDYENFRLNFSKYTFDD